MEWRTKRWEVDNEEELLSCSTSWYAWGMNQYLLHLKEQFSQHEWLNFQSRLQLGHIIALLFKLINKELHEQLYGFECSTAPERIFTNCCLSLSSYHISPIIVWLWIFHVQAKHAGYWVGGDSLWRFIFLIFTFARPSKITHSKNTLMSSFLWRSLISFLFFIVSTSSLQETVKQMIDGAPAVGPLIFCSSLVSHLLTLMSSVNWFFSSLWVCFVGQICTYKKKKNLIPMFRLANTHTQTWIEFITQKSYRDSFYHQRLEISYT